MLLRFEDNVLAWEFLPDWFLSRYSLVIPNKYYTHLICGATCVCSFLFFSTQASVPNVKATLAVMWILNFIYFEIAYTVYHIVLLTETINQLCALDQYFNSTHLLHLRRVSGASVSLQKPRNASELEQVCEIKIFIERTIPVYCFSLCWL